MSNQMLADPSLDSEELRHAIREEYKAVALDPGRGYHFHTGRPLAQMLGYPVEWLTGIPEGAIESFAGTGNPFSLGQIRPGERVVDVGSGAGPDSLIAAGMVGPTGQVVGVDMTPAMLEKARHAAEEAGLTNVEFREGLAEALPVPDGWADVVIDITMVGLGPGDPDLLTREAWHILSNAGEVWLRTHRHPTVAGLPDGPVYHSFDCLYEAHATFADVYSAIADRVIDLGQRDGGVVFAVPGHPLVGEIAVLLILERAKREGLSTRVVAGVSFIEPVLTALTLDPFDAGLQIVDAETLANQYHPIVNVDLPLVVPQLYSRHLASDVKLTLLNAYPPEHEVTLVSGAGTSDVKLETCQLYELDRRSSFDDWTTLYLPPLPAPGSVAAFHNIMAHLRSPEGCPWDREQTHESMRHSLLEETYEVLEAIDASDMGKLREELGDLLMQVLFHTQMAVEGGDFTLPQVAAGCIEKLVHRHPHVFGDVDVSDSRQVVHNWEQLKAEEHGERARDRGPFEGVSAAMPALSQAQEVQSRAARLGFDWPAAEGVWDKVHEELEELRVAGESRREPEFGDALFSLVNLARWLAVDAESALRAANRRFVERFEAMRRLAREQGLALEEMTLEEMDRLWEAVKGDR
ncbi:MAG: nucleoside triphosphate pyrophosphohydrolase [Anaerolineae bacterium]